MTLQTHQLRHSFAGIPSSGPGPSKGPGPSNNFFKNFNGAREVPEIPESPKRVAADGTDTATPHIYLSKLHAAKNAGDTQFWNNVKDFADISGDKGRGIEMASALHNIEAGGLSKVFAAAVTDTITAAEKNLTRLGVEADGMLHNLNLSDENQDVIVKAAKGINTKPEAEALAAIIAKIRRKPGEGYRAELEKKITDKFGVGAMRVAENTAADIFKNAARVFYLKGSNSALDLTTEYLADLFSRPMTDLKAAEVIQTALYFIKSAEEKVEVPAPAENPRAMGPATPPVSPGTVNLSDSCNAPKEMKLPDFKFDFSNFFKMGDVKLDNHGAPVNIGTPAINPSAKQADEAASTENQDTSNTIHVGNLTSKNRNPVNDQSTIALDTVENKDDNKNSEQEVGGLKSVKESESNSALNEASGNTTPSGKENDQQNNSFSEIGAGGRQKLNEDKSKLSDMMDELKKKLNSTDDNVGSGHEGKNREPNTTQPNGHDSKMPPPPGYMTNTNMSNVFEKGSQIAKGVRESLAASDITFEQIRKLAEFAGIRSDEYLPIIREDGVKGWLNSNDLLGDSAKKGRVVTTTNGLNYDLSGKRKYEDSNINDNVGQAKMAKKLTDYKTAIYLRMQSIPGCLEGKEVPEDIKSTPYYMKIIQNNNI